MAVSTSYSPLTFSGNGATTVFAVTWPFFTGTLVVTAIDASGVETTKTITTDYTVSGGTDADGLPATGSVTMLAAPASGTTLRIERRTSKTQTSTWADADSFPAKVVEAAFDRLTLISQENSGSGGGSVNGAALTLDTTGAVDFYNAGSYPVRSSATPSNANDFIPKSFADTNYGGTAATNAANSASAAATSASTASTAATNAATSATNAGNSATSAAASALAAAANSSSPCFTVKWSTNTAATDPGSTYVKGNNAALASITTLYLSETVIEGGISGFQNAMFNGASSGSPAAFVLIKPGSRTNYLAGTVTGHTDSGTYRTLTFTVGASSGSFSADDVLVMIITPAVTSSITAAGLAGAAFGPFTNLASAATCDLSTVSTVGVNITGTTTITSFGTGANLLRIGKFAGALTLTHNATSLILPGGASITTAAGDDFVALSDGSGNWTVVSYERQSGLPVALATTAQFRANTSARALSTDQVWAAADPVTLTDATTVAVDMSTGINFTVTLGGNRTLGAPTNTKNGQSGFILVKQDGTGSRTLAYNAVYKWAGGSAPTLTTTASRTDKIYYIVESSSIIHLSIEKDSR